MKAMILAAGRGERMQQLTELVPKPLMVAGGDSLIAHQVKALVQHGFCDIVINVCYLAKQIISAVGNGSRYGANVVYSYEPILGGLETGGGIYQALPLLGADPFVVVSADLYTEFSYSQLRHVSCEKAHLVLTPNPVFNSAGDFSLSADGCVGLAQERLNYAGIAVLSPRLFDGVDGKKFSLSSRLLPAIRSGQVSGEAYKGAWFNVGTPHQLQDLKHYLASEIGH